MNRGKTWLGVGFFVVSTQTAFWVLYSTTGNMVGSIGVTAGISISLSGILYMLGKIKQS